MSTESRRQVGLKVLAIHADDTHRDPERFTTGNWQEAAWRRAAELMPLHKEVRVEPLYD